MSSRQPAGEGDSTVVAPGNSRTVKDVVRETHELPGAARPEDDWTLEDSHTLSPHLVTKGSLAGGSGWDGSAASGHYG